MVLQPHEQMSTTPTASGQNVEYVLQFEDGEHHLVPVSKEANVNTLL